MFSKILSLTTSENSEDRVLVQNVEYPVKYSTHDRLAQLVERYIDIVEVTSSSLVSVTHNKTAADQDRLLFYYNY